MRLAVLEQLNAARRDREAVALVTDLADGAARVVHEADAATDALGEEVTARLVSGVSGVVATPEGGEAFITVCVPPPGLVVIGAVHISQALAPMARMAGFDVTIVDPRTAFASAERFPDVTVLAEWPGDALPRIGLDRYTALAALTHDPKIDDGALAAALGAGCFYVGALGSRRTHAKRLERLRERGIDDGALDRIRAPIGLAIGAKSPAEIAVAIVAEVVAAWRSRETATREEAA